jgi:hypothetical protein
VEAQQIRFSAGAVTQLDVDRAVNGRQGALSDLADSEAASDLAYAQLGSLLGRTPILLAPLDRALLVLPDGDEARARALAENAQLLANMRSVELAEDEINTEARRHGGIPVVDQGRVRAALCAVWWPQAGARTHRCRAPQFGVLITRKFGARRSHLRASAPPC